MLIESMLRLIPTAGELVVWFPAGLIWSFLTLVVCGKLKVDFHWQTPFTRKINHFVIFTSAAVVSLTGGTSSVCAFALGVSSVIAWAVVRGDGNLLYEAMARERDAPHRTYYIVVPFLSTAFGGILSNLLWGHQAAVLGYLVAGIADALAEPVGFRFGRIRYRVPSRAGRGTTRSVEGSMTVLTASFIISLIYALSREVSPLSLSLLGLLLGLSLLFAVVEALSPHGCDNALLQIVPSWSAAVLLLG